jgi:septum formation protein
MHLILASASPRRAELLAAAGYRFDVVPVEIDERPRAGEAPRAYVSRLASEKSKRAQAGLPPDAIVLGADTAVVVDGEILGKPLDDADAAVMVRRLAGRRHEVMTGVSVRRNGREVTGVETTVVEFAPMGEAEVDWYTQSGEGRDKAGGYGIQGLASRFVTRIEGSYSNVVGLPVRLVHELVVQIASGL